MGLDEDEEDEEEDDDDDDDVASMYSDCFCGVGKRVWCISLLSIFTTPSLAYVDSCPTNVIASFSKANIPRWRWRSCAYVSLSFLLFRSRAASARAASDEE